MSNPTTPKQRALANLRFVRSINEKLFTGFPENKEAFQGCPTDNHLAWTIGHLALSNAWFRSLVDGSKPDLPENFDALFGGKSTPKPDAKAYPALAELKRHYAQQFDKLLSAIEKTSDADLAKPCMSDSGGFASDRLEAADRTAWHEGWHGGQVSSMRRALGLARVMG